MRIAHVAIWTSDLETSRAFYEKFFAATASKKYVNKEKGFSSYFLSFDGCCRLEIMNLLNVKRHGNLKEEKLTGNSHFAISVGSKENVDDLAHQIRNDQFQILSEPRKTGDGYYESVVSDPDGNRVEITI